MASNVDPAFGLAVGKAYMALPDHSDDAHTLASFDAFRRETVAQYRYLTTALGVRVIPQEEDPYADAHALFRALDHGEPLRVLDSSVTGGHPFLTDHENTLFRAVHDYFGHYSQCNTFDRHGEERAYRAHRVMYSTRAIPALTTETRGQNSAFIFVNGGRTFPPQKIALLPLWAHALYPLHTPERERIAS